jgi:hypothetical protein
LAPIVRGGLGDKATGPISYGKIRCGQAPIVGGSSEPPVGGGDDGLGVADGFDRSQVNGVIAAKGVDLG